MRRLTFDVLLSLLDNVGILVEEEHFGRKSGQRNLFVCSFDLQRYKVGRTYHLVDALELAEPAHDGPFRNQCANLDEVDLLRFEPRETNLP